MKSFDNIHCVTDDSKREDHGSKGIASVERVTAEELCDCFVVVFLGDMVNGIDNAMARLKAVPDLAAVL